MNREFVINILILISINFLIKPLYLFGVETQVQNLVGISEWGIYFELFNFAFLFHIIHEPGIQSYNSKTIAQNPEKISYYFPRIFGIKLILLVLFMVTVTIAFFLFGFKPMLLKLLLFIGINQFLSALYIYLRTNIASIGKYRTDSIMSSLDKLLMLFIVGFLAYHPVTAANFQIIWLAYGQFAALIIACVVALGIISGSLPKFSIVFSWDYLKELVAKSYPFAMIFLFMSIYSRVDGVMLGRMLNDGGYQAGLYGACYRILDALNMLGYLFAALLLPMYSSKIKHLSIIKSLLNVSFRSLAFIVIISATTLFVFGKEILYWLYDDATMEFVSVMHWLTIGFMMISMAYLFGTLLVAHGDLKQLNVLYFSGIIINVLMNLWLIPYQQSIGAAKATVITEVLMTIGQVYLCFRLVRVDIPLKIVLKTIFFGVLCAIVFLAISKLLFMHFIWKIMISIMISFFIALGIQLLEPRELLNLASRKI